jgi:predicted phage baseplate assembly protein
VSLYDPPDKPDSLLLRKTVASVVSKAQTLAVMPYVEPIEGTKKHQGASSITLDRMVLGLTAGKAVMVKGIEAGDPDAVPAIESTGVTRFEVAVLSKVTHAGGLTTLHFDAPLTYRYVRSTVSINANVVLATHGETAPTEVLGSGDGSAANQAFTLRKAPLTYVSAATAEGSQSTLEVRVNGVSWQEVSSLYEQSPRSQAYVVRHAEDGTATVEFGDGVHGARLPTGRENVVATYRTGIGTAGNVKARQLSLLLNPPLGVRSTVNPIAASGGADGEVLDDARRNAPLTVLTLDRVVSLTDFEDFTRGFAGVGKAHAEAIWSGHRRVIYLSVADATGEELDPDLPLYQNLASALAQLSDGTDEIQIGDIDPATSKRRTYIERTFTVAADVGIEPAYDSETVLADAEAALAAEFAFDARQLGQHVSEAEVLTAIQNIAGVAFARLTRLGDKDDTDLPAGGVLVARNAEWRDDSGVRWIRPAELWVINPSAIALTEVKS